MGKQKNKQLGFTLVELAVVMVIIGILLGAILKGQQMIDNARGKRVLNDLKGVEALVWTHFDRRGVFPGDCDGDGLMGATETVATVSGSPVDPLSSATNGPIVDDLSCNGVTGTDSINTPLADMREEQLLPWGISNSRVSLHVSNGQIRPTFITHSVSGEMRNAIIVYDIPQWMGEMIDASIDGEVDGAAGRVRFFDTNPEGAAWPPRALIERSSAIAFLFDKSF